MMGPNQASLMTSKLDSQSKNNAYQNKNNQTQRKLQIDRTLGRMKRESFV